jgi:hypothetical protein
MKSKYLPSTSVVSGNPRSGFPETKTYAIVQGQCHIVPANRRVFGPRRLIFRVGDYNVMGMGLPAGLKFRLNPSDRLNGIAPESTEKWGHYEKTSD